MAHKVKLSNLITKQIRAWALPDQIEAEIYLFLTHVLPADVATNLTRESGPFDGMVAQCVRRDPHVQGRDHQFFFQVQFGQDEETLFISSGDYYTSQID